MTQKACQLRPLALIILLAQLRVPAVEQVGVPGVVQPDGGGIPGEPDHQLGRHPLGGPSNLAMGPPAHTSRHLPH